MNLVCLLIPLLLFGAVFIRFVTIDVRSPKIGPTTREPTEKLNLCVTVTDQGFHIDVNPQHRLSWMTAVTRADSTIADIPKKDNDWDYQALNRRLLEIKEANRQETAIILSAEDDIAFEVMIKAMDWSRGTPDNPLFPDVTLARGVV